ncbi:MAG: hypothetical protein JXR96_20150 [Deltaproteobacteria bacterium]|nr:hypothetical protein [Deltaproteobacteria bacterium]
MSRQGGKSYLLDSSVLIDFLDVDSSILTSFAKEIGPVFVVHTILEEEIDGLDENGCIQLGMTLYHPSFEQLLESRQYNRPQRYDYLVFIVAPLDFP